MCLSVRRQSNRQTGWRRADYLTKGPVASVTPKNPSMLRMRLGNEPRTGARRGDSELRCDRRGEKSGFIKMWLACSVCVWSESYLTVSAWRKYEPSLCRTIKLCVCLRDYKWLRVIVNFIPLCSNNEDNCGETVSVSVHVGAIIKKWKMKKAHTYSAEQALEVVSSGRMLGKNVFPKVFELDTDNSSENVKDRQLWHTAVMWGGGGGLSHSLLLSSCQNQDEQSFEFINIVICSSDSPFLLCTHCN